MSPFFQSGYRLQRSKLNLIGLILLAGFCFVLLLGLFLWQRQNNQTAQAEVGAAALSWTTAAVDTAGGRNSSIALNTSGNPRISYNVNDLKYTFCDATCTTPANWTILTIESGTFSYTSLALDGTNNPRIAYYDTVADDLKFAICSTQATTGCDEVGDWTTYAIDTGGDVGSFVSLVLDTSGNPRISYYDTTNRNLKYAYCSIASNCNEAGDWAIVTVDAAGNITGHLSLVLDTANNPRISYKNDVDELKFALCSIASLCDVTGDWTTLIVDTVGNVGAYSSLVLDSSNNPRISYRGDSTWLKFASCDISTGCDEASDWASHAVDTNQGGGDLFSSIAIDTAGNLAITYRKVNGDFTRDMAIAYCPSATGCNHIPTTPFIYNDWVLSDVESAVSTTSFILENSLVFGPSSTIYVSYYHPDDDDLKFAALSNTTPSVPTLISPVSATTVSTTSPQLFALYSDPDDFYGGTIDVRVSSGSAANCLSNVSVVSSGASAQTATGTDPAYFAASGLTNSTTYNWCAKNNDGLASSAWTTMGSFTVNTAQPALGLVYSTFMGGTNGENIWDLVVDSAGNVYMTGRVTSTSTIPVTSGVFQSAGAGSTDVFVTKLNPQGNALIFSTYLGSTSADFGYDIFVDSSSNVFVTGRAGGSYFPTTAGAYDTTGGGNQDAFVTKLSPTGSALIYSTYLTSVGGTDNGQAIVVDSSGNAYVTGLAYNVFPTTAGAVGESLTSQNAFITKLNPTGSALVFSGLLGTDASGSSGYGIAIDSSGNSYVIGRAQTGFPTTAGAFDETHNGGAFDTDVFLSKVNATGTALVYSTYLGGASGDFPYDVSVDASGNAFVLGFTNSSAFPTTAGAYDESYNSGGDAFVTKVNPAGSGLVFSTFIGGDDDDTFEGGIVDSSGNSYLTGYTCSSDYPVTANAVDSAADTSYCDAYITKLNPTGTALVYSSHLGGTNEWESGYSVDVDSSGNAYIGGEVWSSNFPTTTGAYDESHNGSADIFVTKYSFNGSPGVPVLVSPVNAGTIKTTTPELYARYNDPDAADVGTVNFRVSSGTAQNCLDNASVVASGTSTTTSTNNEPAKFAVTPALSNGSTYQWCAENNDGELLSGSSFTTMGSFTVDMSPLIVPVYSYSTFISGTAGSDEEPFDIVVDAADNIYVIGRTNSTDFPTTTGAYDGTVGGGGFYDVFVIKLNPPGDALIYATYLGGDASDQGKGIDIDSTGNAYITGSTSTSGFPTTAGAYDTTLNGSDAFVTKLHFSGSSLVYSTFFGGQ